MDGRCEAEVFDGYNDDGDVEVDICSAVLNPDGCCPRATGHL